MSVAELQTQLDQELNACQEIVTAHEKLNIPLTSYAQQNFDTRMRKADDLKLKIAAAKPAPTRSLADARAFLAKQPRMSGAAMANGTGRELILPARFSRDYHDAFYSRLSGQGVITAAMNEGLASSGGAAVPVVVDNQVVPLAPMDSAVRRLSTVVSTRSDVRMPQITVRGVASTKSETSSFPVAAPTLGQFTVGAYTIAVETQITLGIAEDAPLFADAVLKDVASAFLELEETKFIFGDGTTGPQGVLGNIGAGVTAEPDGSNTVTTAGIRSLIGTLKESFALNASFLMTKATALIVRASQTQSGLYEHAFTRVGNQDFLFGYPVAYSSQMPAATRGNTPVIFGDWSKGYLIADRGGPALLMKRLDQAEAAQGLIDLLFYRRSDGRVRVSEALQGLTISAS